MRPALAGLVAAIATLAAGAAGAEGFGGFTGSGVETRPEATQPAAPRSSAGSPSSSSGAAAPARLAPGQAAERAMGLTRGKRREIQQGLNETGHPVGAPDGALGRRSRAAIADFQKEQGLPVTGYWSPEADARLSALRGAGAPSGAAGQAAAAAAPAADGALSDGDYTAEKAAGSAWWGDATLSGGVLSLALKARSNMQRVETLRCKEPLGPDGDFTCYLRKSGWSMRTVYGKFPNLRIDATGDVGGGELRFRKVN